MPTLKLFQYITIVAILSLLSSCSHAESPSLDENVSNSKERPNFLIILADDVSPDIYGAYGQPAAVSTPNVDALARTGVMFKTAYATAMCGPSRAEIMTGKYGNTTGAYHNSIWLGGVHEDLYDRHLAFGKALRDMGYATAIAGKWHAGKQEPYEDAVGFQEYCLWSGRGELKKFTGKPTFPGAWEDEDTPARYWHPSYICNGDLVDTKPDDYGPDIEAAFISDFIKRQAKAGKPFLAYWPTVAPHGTRQGYPTTPHQGAVGDISRVRGKDAKVRFGALNEYLDHLFGTVMTTLEDANVADNTIVIFLSDNGTAVTAKTRGIERGSHVVSVIGGGSKWVKQRGATDELMDLSDIMPTLLDYAGSAAPEQKFDGRDFDGTSLKPFLTGKSDHHREWIYGYISGSQIVRTKTHLLEAVNPILGMPQGRFYHSGENRFWRGYQRVEGVTEHTAARAELDAVLAKLPPLTTEHPYWRTKRGKKFLKRYTTPKSRRKHLFSHRDYDFNDESE